MTVGFVKLQRTQVMLELLQSDPSGFHLLTNIAIRADRTTTGEARIGDWKKMGMTSRGAYRNACKRLIGANLVTITTTKAGSIAKLIDTTVYDINQEDISHQPSHQPSHQEPKKQAIKQATNKKFNNIFKQEVKERGVPEELISDWLTKVRSAKSNTERALNAQLKNLDYLIGEGYSALKIFEVINERNWQGIRTGTNQKDQFFIEAIREVGNDKQTIADRINDVSWAGGDQRNIRDPGRPLPGFLEEQDGTREESRQATLVISPVTISGECGDGSTGQDTGPVPKVATESG